MHTKKIFSNLVGTGIRLIVLASMLIAALVSNITPAFAAPPATLTALTLGAPSGTLTTGTAGSITYLVTVTKNTSNNNTSAALTLTWAAPGAPTGVTTSFTPSPVSWTGTGTGGSGPKTSILTITTTAATPAVTRNFTVRAQRSGSGSDFQTISGTLTVGAPLLTPTVTFGAAPTPTFPGSNFAVSATTNSNGAITYSFVSGPCAFVSGNSFSASGVGTCVVQASTAATSTYAAGSAQQSITITASGPVTALDLYAVTGSTTLPGLGSPVTVWGYNTTNTSVTKPGGPVLIVNQNDNVSITLHNQLAESTALLFQGQSMIPDLTGAGAGTNKTYSFVASQPGTFLYEAGLIPGSQHQVAMGLYGVLIVRPIGFASVPGQAYGSADSAFNSEQVLVLSELDTALNVSSNPAAFDMRKYSPKYYLINGQAYPNIPALPSVVAGDKVLLRYVDAGLQAHSMSTLGLSQTIVGQDGIASGYPHTVVAETIAPGQTLDTIVTIPTTAVVDTKYPLYDASLFLRNNKGTAAAAGLGGMLTTLTVGTGAPPPPPVDTTGPVASALGLSPNPTNGSGDVAVSASISDVTTGNSNIDQAEFYIDSTASSPITMSAVDTSFNSTTEAVTGTIPAAILAGLSSGNHTIYVRGHDAALPTGNWGAFLAITLNLDKTGPATSGLSLSPNPSSGAVTVALSATGDDSASGNSDTTAATYTVDGILPATPMAIVAAPNGPVRSFTATISAGLAQGTHVVSVTSQDSFGNVGIASTINLVVSDTVPPTVSNISASPNPNNGSTPFNTSVPAVRVFASFSDASTGNSNLANAEGFLDAAGATGTGFVFIANDGLFNTPAEGGYADIPLPVVNTLSPGAHLICIHAKDAAGNWGAVNCSYSLVIDKAPPTVSAAALAPSATNNAAVVVSATANDATSGNSNIGGGEYFIDTLGTAGTGAAMTPAAALPNTTISATIPAATIGALTAGNHTVYVRAKDAAGNWSTTTANATLLIDRTAPTFTSITLSPNTIPLGTTSINLTVNGASDPAPNSSGVAGGEYWFGNTNITAGTGTAFTGLTTSINTSALTANTTVRVRIRDAAGNWSTGTNGVRTATLTVTAPTVTSINRLSPTSSTTNAASVQFQVTFSQSVAGGAASNFSLTTNGTFSTLPSITSVTGTGTTRTVTVSTGTNSGGGTHTIRLNMANSTGMDAVGGLPFTAGQSYTIDKTAPTVSSINRLNANPTTASSVQFRVTFSENVTGVTASNFVLTLGATYSVVPTITSVSGSNTTWTITVNTGTNSGGGTHTIRLDMVNSTGVADAGGNAVSNVPYTAGQSYTKN